MKLSLSKNRLTSTNMSPIPVTAFDFTEGGFIRAERTRWTMIGGLGAGLLVLMFVLLSGTNALVGTRSAQSGAESTDSLNQQNLNILQDLDSYKGFAAADLQKHIEAREALQGSAFTTQGDNTRLITEAIDAAPVGIQLRGVSLTWASAIVQPLPTTTKAPAPNASKSAGGGPTTTRILVVSGLAQELNQIEEYVNKISQITGVESVLSPVWGGQPPDRTFTITATLGPKAALPLPNASKSASAGQDTPSPSLTPSPTPVRSP